MKNEKLKQINWYPGHMFKSFKEIRSSLKLMDIIFILIDSRIPYSSMNPEILKVLKDKPTIILFNKIDLSDSEKTNKWILEYQKKGFTCLAINAKTGLNTKEIKNKVDIILKEKNENRASKGLKKKNFKTMVLGIPNVGKSTLINTLSNRRSTRTENRPGVTKSKQWVKLSEDFDLLDMPGLLWPKFEDSRVGYNLAITGAIKDNILPIDDVCNEAIKYLQKNYLNNLKSRYGNDITSDMEYISVLDVIGKKRGALSKNNEIDYDRVYQIILSDIRNNELGKLTFDDERI